MAISFLPAASIRSRLACVADVLGLRTEYVGQRRPAFDRHDDSVNEAGQRCQVRARGELLQGLDQRFA